MSNELASAIAQWRALMPIDVQYRKATELELLQFEAAFGQIPHQYRQFLLEGGGGAVGPEWIDGIDQLQISHQKFVAETGPDGWQSQMFPIGWDGSGGAIGIDNAGAVLVESDEHHVFQLASSFHAFLVRHSQPD